MVASAAAVSVAATEVAVWLVCVIPVAVMNVTVTELAVWLVMVTSVAVVSGSDRGSCLRGLGDASGSDGRLGD